MQGIELPSAEVAFAILGMGIATYLCRAGGLAAMGFVPLTRRVQAFLRAIPMAVLAAIMAPYLLHSGPAEYAGVAAAAAAQRWTGNDFLGVFAGVGSVVVVRAVLAQLN